MSKKTYFQMFQQKKPSFRCSKNQASDVPLRRIKIKIEPFAFSTIQRFKKSKRKMLRKRQRKKM
jgi:hypothetical protein